MTFNFFKLHQKKLTPTDYWTNMPKFFDIENEYPRFFLLSTIIING